MYNLTRQEAAEVLGVSTRSLDRYIKSGKIRAKKDGKIVYVHNQDIENMSDGGEKKQEVIIEKKKKPKVKIEKTNSVEVSRTDNYTSQALDIIYSDLKGEIQRKDELIKELSIRLGRAEEIAKNSVSINDFKRSQFLLEESKDHLNKEIEDVTRERNELKKKLIYEKSSNIILIVVCIILFIVAGIIWFTGI